MRVAGSILSFLPRQDHLEKEESRQPTFSCYKTFAMMSHDTVLVVGAGGSMPFGFPSGIKLVAELVGQIRFARRGKTPEPLTALSRQLLDAGCNEGVLENFRTKLRDSQAYSVDAFLERHPEFVDVGKLAIACSLIPRENADALFDKEDSWYRYLSNRLVDNIGAGFKRPLTVITYNYDRSLEYYLYRSLENALRYSSEQMMELMCSLNIIHVHGSLGALPWQAEQSDQVPRPYGQSGKAIAAAMQIKIIHEDEDDSAAYEQARGFLGQASRVCFLGFGCHRTNVRRLRAKGWPDDGVGHSIYGTCVGLLDGEQRRCGGLLDNRIRLFNMDCLDFLRFHVGVIT